MITFPAFYGDADRKAAIIARIAECGEHSLVGLLSGTHDDLAQAHEQSGFPAPLIALANAVFAALAPTEARRFALDLVTAVPVGRNMAEVAEQVYRCFFADIVERHGRAQLLAAIDRSEGLATAHLIRQLLEPPSPAMQQKDKAEAKKARRRGLDLPSPTERLVIALAAWAERYLTIALTEPLRWVASLDGDEAEFYRRCSTLLVETVGPET